MCRSCPGTDARADSTANGVYQHCVLLCRHLGNGVLWKVISTYSTLSLHNENLVLSRVRTDLVDSCHHDSTAFPFQEFGFTREQSGNALIIHGTVEKALEVLSSVNQPGEFVIHSS